MIHALSVRALAAAAMAGGVLVLAAACSGDSGTKATPTVEVKTISSVTAAASETSSATAVASKTTAAASATTAAASATTAAATTAAASTPAGGGGGTASDGKVAVQLMDNHFEPKDIKVPVGKEVEIDLKNVGAAIHNMHVLSQAAEGKDYSSDLMVNPGTESKFKVKFSKPGTYQFQCDFHVPDMVGTITAS